jgi:hypothetical protein
MTAMLKRGGGHIVNIATTMVEHANSSAPTLPAALTKGGLVACGCRKLRRGS